MENPLPFPRPDVIATDVARDVADLRPTLEAEALDIVARETRDLTAIGATEAKSLRELLERTKKRILNKQREVGSAADAPKFAIFEEQRQQELDRREWVRKLQQLDRDLVAEPQRIIDGYNVQAHRLEPVGLVYLWPQTN